MRLSPIQEKFVLHWGEMGTRWGINRSVAQIHALLYLSPKALHAEEIAETLSIARSNVSTSIKELQGWGIVKLVHVLGDKRDHFECMKDVWEMFRIVLKERKRREIDPTVFLLEECLAECGSGSEPDTLTAQRLRELQRFFQVTTACYERISKLPATGLTKFMATGDKVLRALGIG